LSKREKPLSEPSEDGPGSGFPLHEILPGFRSALPALCACGGLVTGAAGRARAAVSAAAGLTALFIPPQDSHSRGGKEDQSKEYK